MKTKLDEKVLEWIDNRENYIIDFLRDLIAIPTLYRERILRK